MMFASKYKGHLQQGMISTAQIGSEHIFVTIIYLRFDYGYLIAFFVSCGMQNWIMYHIILYGNIYPCPKIVNGLTYRY